MPRNGNLARVTLALAAAALLGALAVTSATAANTRSNATLKGAGSSLMAPAVAVWQTLYRGDSVQYSGIGSGGGIKAIQARTVDFGASDAPLTKSQGEGCHGCVQIPWALSATSPVVNVPGVAAHRLKLTGPVLAGIYLGKITNWNDTYVFTNYLSKVSHKWKTKVGNATTVSWPAGVGGNKNNGVAAIVGSTPGTIGYVSVAYTIANHLKLARLKNASGKYVLPTLGSIEAAAQLVKGQMIPANNKISITDPPASKKYRVAYPLATFTYVIVPQQTPKAAELKAFVKWALGAQAQGSIKRLVFAPLPAAVVKAAKKSLGTIHS